MCKILAAYEIKPHKVRYYLERRDRLFDEKTAEVLSVVVKSNCSSNLLPRTSEKARRLQSSPMTKSPASSRLEQRCRICRQSLCDTAA
ncbi:hypothetical protein [Methylocystis suflitae]|uniref:hypothetical protein n=1 Tax=Methylocystis suflitae TaxID=2951405 RepID=UPI00210D1C4A|nr:hypothetical protein [Methylocystis suflitae]MCQ4190003.1 hypothetical protein [Methylocystis suflitae]